MNSESRIGAALMSRRIELGLSLEQAARDTNIRARMLEVLESGDYSQYPPRGHAIGMLSSYARYLELDSTAIIQSFDVEYEAFKESEQIARSAHNTRRGVGRFGERVSGEKSRPTSREGSRSRSRTMRKRGSEAADETPSKMSRSLENEARAKDDERYRSGSVRVVGTRSTGTFRSVRGARDATGSMRAAGRDEFTPGRGSASGTGAMRRSPQARSSQRQSPTGSFSRQRTGDMSGREEDKAPNFFGVDVSPDPSSVKRRTRRHDTTRNATTENHGAARPDENIFERLRRILASIFSERRTRLIALAFAVIVVAVIIAASVLIGTAGKSDSGVIPVQGGASNDTMTTDGENAAHKTITTANGNPVIIKVEVAKGQTSLVEITYDGANAYKGTAVGGQFSREFPVTESFTATFSNPAAVTVTENDNPIDIPLDEDGKTGSLYISVQAAPK